MRSQRSVKVNKTELLTKLKEGRERHQVEYAAAKEGYVITLREELQSKLATLDAGDQVDLIIRNRPPENNISDYDSAIELFTWELESEIELEYDEFQSFVLDNWAWKEVWASSNEMYMSAANVKAPR